MRLCPIIPLLVALAAVLASCDRGRVIPKDRMAEIYAEMFLADQWIEANPQVRRAVDTTCVYEAVFEKYGYDADDYRASMDHYMDDPERFAKILRRSASILEARMAELDAERKVARARRASIKVKFDFDRIMVPDSTGWFRMADRDSLRYFADTADVLVLDPFYYDTADKMRVKDSPIADK